MSFSHASENDDGINEINMTPLVDVMLVLLIIFIVTIPIVKQTIEIDLPEVSGEIVQQKPETIEISVSASGDYYLDGQLTSDEELQIKFSTVANPRVPSERTEKPSLQIHGDKEVKYARIAQLRSMAQRSGLNKIGFVMEGEAIAEMN